MERKGWSIIPSSNVGRGANALFAVAALSPTDVWAVGGYYLGNTTFNTLQLEHESHTLAEHWDGKVWSVVSSPDPAATGGDASINVLSALTVVSPNDIWAVALTPTHQPRCGPWPYTRMVQFEALFQLRTPVVTWTTSSTELRLNRQPASGRWGLP